MSHCSVLQPTQHEPTVPQILKHLVVHPSQLTWGKAAAAAADTADTAIERGWHWQLRVEVQNMSKESQQQN